MSEKIKSWAKQESKIAHSFSFARGIPDDETQDAFS